MTNVNNAIVAAGLQNQIKVSTATYSGITSGFPPSQGSFQDSAKGFIEPIIQFLAQNNMPLLANIYPYFSYLGTPEIDLQYALFTAPNVVVTDLDGNHEYRNLFDALLDTLYSAVERSGGPNIEIVVSESGWPSAGDKEATVQNAQIKNNHLIK
ncbi:Glycoside hydrolase, catalytic domain-containing protein [Heracleum sosnowskyi]|uniref:Glycoside hydrolase, catalytic domain-containing protein n=1 Tax=Heracleum sosnowskyi TaxID=360622 RepID=A0AAD8IY47_9APIA|nr:Glycoside hydrolase, catalytic domain-containing protein [Heracleum sosnowskyi]